MLTHPLSLCVYISGIFESIETFPSL